MNQNIHQEAKERVAQLKKFYNHLGTYVITNIILLVINLVTDPKHLWFYWIVLFWGIGVALQAFKTFGPGAKMTQNWEQNKINEYVAKNSKKNSCCDSTHKHD